MLIRILTWTVALTFAITGASKLASVPPSPENFERWGFSPWFMFAIGATEVLGALGLVVGRTTPIARWRWQAPWLARSGQG